MQDDLLKTRTSKKLRSRAGVRPSVRASVYVCMRLLTLSNMNISETSAPIEILSEASLGWGKAALGFGPDRIGTLVSMATDNSHRVIIGKFLLAL